MAVDASPLVRPRLVAGIVVFLIGGVFLADQIGALSAESAVALWPVGVVALGLVTVLQPDPINRRVGVVLLLAGVWLLFNAAGWWEYSFWRTWPYLLVILGGWLLYRVHELRDREGPADRATGGLGNFDARVSGSPWVGALAFLNAVERVASAPELVGGELHAVLGECDVDLSAPRADDALIDAFALLGSVTITVPAGCRVENRVLPILGRVDDRSADAPSAPSNDDRPAIVVRGAAILGRVEVEVAG